MGKHEFLSEVKLHNDERDRSGAKCSCGFIHPIQKENKAAHIHLYWVEQDGIFSPHKPGESEFFIQEPSQF